MLKRCSTIAIAATILLFSGAISIGSGQIFVNVSPGNNIGSGFGQLSSARQDLRITVQFSGAFYYVYAYDVTGRTMWSLESSSSTSATVVGYGSGGAPQGIQEDEMGWISVGGMSYNPSQPGMMGPGFNIAVANCLFPCKSCGIDPMTGMPTCGTMSMCSETEEGSMQIAAGDNIDDQLTLDTVKDVTVTVHHGLPGTLTIQGATSDLLVLNPDGSPFTSATLVGSGVDACTIRLQTQSSFTGPVTLTCRFLEDGAQQDSQDNLVVVQAPPTKLALSPDPQMVLTTNPDSNAKITPGRSIKFGVYINDSDTFTVNGTATVTSTLNTVKTASMLATIKLTNATFVLDDTRKATDISMIYTKTLGFAATMDITVDANWDGSTPVQIDVTVQDKGTFTLPNGWVFAAGTVATSAQDKDVSKTVKFGSAIGIPLPTTMVAIKQSHPTDTGAIVVDQLFSAQSCKLTYMDYQFGADLNGANPAPNYQGLLVNESFSPVRTNIMLDWIRDDQVAAARAALQNPNATADAIVNWFQQGRTLSSTFMIDDKDQIHDQYGVIGPLVNVATNLLKPNFADRTFTLELDQMYSVKPGATILTILVKATLRYDGINNKVLEYSQQVSPE